MTAYSYLSIDHGAGNLKLHGAHGSIIMPTRAATARDGHLSSAAGLRIGKPPLRIKTDGWQIYVGDTAHNWGRAIDDLSDARFITGAPGTRAVTYAAITHYILQHGLHCHLQNMTLYVGLPHTALSGDDAAATVHGVKSWLKGHHEWQVNDSPYYMEVADVVITTQAAGALFDYLLDDDGQFRPGKAQQYRKKEIGVLSVGMNTIELMAINGREVTQKFTSGETLGVRRLLELCDPGNLYTRGELDARLRAGTLDTASTLPVWSSEVNGHIERVWGRAWRRFAAVVVVGGGAVLLRERILAQFNGRTHIPNDPVGAIGRGLYKMAQQRENRKRK